MFLRLSILAWLLGGATLSAQSAVTSDREGSSPVDARFRLQWPSDPPRQDWVRLELVDPDSAYPTTISEIKNCSQSALATGAFASTDDDRTLLFRPRAALADGAVEFRVRASDEARLVIQFIDRSKHSDSIRCFDENAGTRRTIALRDLLGGQEFPPDTENAVDSGTRWSLKRLDRDGLCIELDRPDFIYESTAESTLGIDLSGRSLLGLAGQIQQLSVAIIRVADNTVVASHEFDAATDNNGHFTKVHWQPNVPKSPGVYEIRCELRHGGSRIWSRLRRRSETTETAEHPFVVLPAENQRESSDPREWREISLIRPAEPGQPGLNQWLPVNTARLNPLATPVPPQPIRLGEHAGQTTSIFDHGNPFETTLPTLAAGSPQKVTLRYPAGRRMQMRVQVLHRGRNASPDFTLSQKSAATKSDWAEHTFLYYPGTGETRIRITNLSQQDDAMIESISVQAGPGRLTPGVRIEHEEADPSQRLAIYSLSDLDWVDEFTHDVDLPSLLSRHDQRTVALHQLMIATDRLRDYLSYAGMNAVVIPAIDRNRAGFPATTFRPCYEYGRVDELRLHLTIKLLESSPLQVFAGVDTSATFTGPESWLINNPQSSESIVGPRSDVPNYNPRHHKTREALVTLSSELDAQLGQHPNYAGLVFTCGADSHLSPHSGNRFNPIALAAFNAATSGSAESIPTTNQNANPQQPADGKRAFDAWKSRKLRELLQLIADTVRGKTLYRIGADSDASGIVQSLVEKQAHVENENDASTAASKNAVFVMEVRRDPVGTLPLSPSVDRLYNGLGPSELAGSLRSGRSSGVCLIDPPVTITSESSRQNDASAPQPSLRHRTSMDVTRLVERSDSHYLMFDGASGAATINPVLAGLLRDWTALPTGGVSPLQPSDPKAATAKLRFGARGGHYYLLAINPSPWESDITVQTSTALRWRKAGAGPGSADDPVHPADGISNNGLRMTVQLAPRSFVVLKAGETRSGVEVLDWFARVRGGKQALEEITQQVTKIVDRLGSLADPPTYPALSNGGFESESGVGLPGWLHAQHPPGAVQIDDSESIEGQQSVRLTTNRNVGDRTWLVSETIQPPQSGRLGVSLACRAELVDTETAHRLKVSIEGTRAGEPIRQSAEIEVPHNGQWQPRQMVLEIDGVDPTSVDLLRLTIDSLSKGRVWIDDVRLHDWFPLSQERGELQGEAYVAVQGLQRGNLTPAARLIQNEWAQHLLATETPSPPDVIETVAPDDAPTGVAERIRSWLPTPLRF